ncbi:MAG: ATP-dependent zinc metalloprotease FtsH [Pseudomonadota bacterium]|nr:ATP-dependent zinc metalloprotease FtsH [Pseudomonadota bacterium]MDE3037496.1 ATP-dependent zinc metalloprotease FtsH [Pseudomonadota bacterium]
MRNYAKHFLIWLAILLVVMALFNMFQGGVDRSGMSRLPFSSLLDKIDQNQVTDVVIHSDQGKGSVVTGHLSDGTAFVTQAPEYPGMIDRLTAKNVKITAVGDDGKMDSLWSVLISWFPLLLLVGVYIFFMRQMQSGGRGGGALGFGKSRARLLTEKTERVTFEDVAGIEEAKDELYEIVDFLKDPQKYQRLGGKIPKGCLLVGPPGTGKTLLARAIAGEAKVPFFTISGSDFVEMFVGVGASRVRDMFEQGKKSAPCIIFIDEIDAVGRHRGAGLGGGNDEREQTLNQLLVEMDGFEANESVIILAATNRPDVLDPALLRPGRFDRQITVPNPDINGRAKILNVHLKKVPKGPDVDARIIARGTPGFSGADLANIVNEAALLAARLGKKVITMRDLESAKDKVMMGAERKSMVMSEEEKKMTAYHEGGHALVSIYSPASDPIHKATIIPRGRALGMVMRLPEADKLSYPREKMYADLAVSMGGRVAEEIIFGYDKVSSGASSDIKYATKLARAMVTEWGMSDKVGPIFYGNGGDHEVFLGYSMGQPTQALSEDMANLIDAEVKRIVEDARTRAHEVLTQHLDTLHRIAGALLEYETLSGDEIKTLAEGGAVDRQGNAHTKKSVAGKSSLPSSRARKTAGSAAAAE